MAIFVNIHPAEVLVHNFLAFVGAAQAIEYIGEGVAIGRNDLKPLPFLNSMKIRQYLCPFFVGDS